MTEIRQRVVCYITRNQRELLVFSHPPEYTTAGIQVPGGGMEHNETQAAAAIRETLEETGLHLQNPVYLGSRSVHLPDAKYPDQEFHYYWLEANTETRDSWTHFAEEKYLFTHQFVPLEQIGAEIELRWHMADFIPELQRRLTIRQRVVVYITRNRNELLVFEHDDPGLQAGTQVVAGGVDEGETLEAAATREVFEEAGLELQNPILLGSKDVIWPGPKNPNQRWHFFWLETLTDTPDAWDHTVTAGEDDMGMVYRQRFVKLEEVKLDWGLDAKLSSLVQQIWKGGSDREWIHEGMLRYGAKFLTVIKRFEELGLTNLLDARDYLDHGESGLAYDLLCHTVIETGKQFSSELIDDLLELGAGFDYESGVFRDGDLEYFEYALNELRLTK